jgi:hypothetical protein
MTTATATFARRNQNLYRQPSKLNLGPVSVSFLTIATVSVLALLYLTQITKTNVFGQKVSELKVRRDKIVAEQQSLEVEAARLQSIQQIQSSKAVSHLVPEQPGVFASRR